MTRARSLAGARIAAAPAARPGLGRRLAWCALALALAAPAAADDGRALIFLFDTSGSLRASDLARAQELARRHLDGLGGDDRVAVMSFADRPELVAPFGRPRAAVEEALGELRTGGRFTTLYDALWDASELLSTVAGRRRGIVLFTDGVDENSAVLFEDAQEAVVERKVTVFAIGVGRRLDERTLRRFVKLTRGRYFNAAELDDPGAVLAAIDDTFAANEALERRVREAQQATTGRRTGPGQVGGTAAPDAAAGASDAAAGAPSDRAAGPSDAAGSGPETSAGTPSDAVPAGADWRARLRARPWLLLLPVVPLILLWLVARRRRARSAFADDDLEEALGVSFPDDGEEIEEGDDATAPWPPARSRSATAETRAPAAPGPPAPGRVAGEAPERAAAEAPAAGDGDPIPRVPTAPLPPPVSGSSVTGPTVQPSLGAEPLAKTLNLSQGELDAALSGESLERTNLLTETPVLVVRRGRDVGQAYLLQPGDTYLGRAQINEIVLDDPSISGRHARVRVEGRVITALDLGSTNGSFLNERRLEDDQMLSPGDILRLGETELTFKIEQRRA